MGVQLHFERSTGMLVTMWTTTEFLYILLLCVVNSELISAEDETNSFSFKIGNFKLFNLPIFARSSSSSARVTTAGPSTLVDYTTNTNYIYDLIESQIDPNILEDSNLKTPELVRKYGYPMEVHHVTTMDNYILELHRIGRPNATAVLLAHGLLDSSATWVLMGPQKGLGYLLYDEGYDVWMLNVRGNTYSRNHTRYNTRHAEFWDFTFHEMGIYDLPATIDYVLQESNQEQLHYIGHSQGSLIFWIMCSERPQYTHKVKLMQAMGPVAYISNSKSPIVNFLAFFHDPLIKLLNLIGTHEFLPNNEFIAMFEKIICDEDVITEAICTNVLFLVSGFDRQQMNETMLPVILGHAPAGASTKQMQHYGQLKESGKFRQYDYGWYKNRWRYHTSSPPDYKLSNVRCKVALHYSLNDWLAVPKDVEKLQQELPNVLSKLLVELPSFNHLDFVWGTNAKDLVYKRIFKLMELVEQKYF